MKLRLIEYQDGFVAVDENVNNSEFVISKINNRIFKNEVDDLLDDICYGIIAASKSLNLQVPIIPDLKEWEIENLVGASWEKEQIGYPNGLNPTPFRIGFILGYKLNKAEFTEDDIRKAFSCGQQWVKDIVIDDKEDSFNCNDLLKSIRKTPKYIVVETESTVIGHNGIHNIFGDKLKLISNNELIIKEIIYV